MTKLLEIANAIPDGVGEYEVDFGEHDFYAMCHDREMPQTSNGLAFALAKEAVKAMRVPTGAMCEAGAACISPDIPPADSALACWVAMIDAILNESPSGA